MKFYVYESGKYEDGEWVELWDIVEILEFIENTNGIPSFMSPRHRTDDRWAIEIYRGPAVSE